MMRRAALLILALLALGPAARAQSTCTAPSAPSTCTTTTGATLTIGKVVQLTLGGTASVIPVPADTDYTKGYVTFTGQTATIRANASVVVTVKAATATWTATNTTPGVAARTNKPSTDLQLATSAAGPFTPLTTAGYTLITTAGATTGTSLTLTYRTLLSWTLDTPGQYGLDVVYTITAP
jgi:hypothetical protein